MNICKTSFPALGAVLIALLPQAFCPACWPAYAGVLSSMGLSFIDYPPYLLPMMSFFLVIALWGLFHKARTRKGYRPFYLGLLAALGIVLGKFAFELDSVLYASVLLFISASIWNTWPAKQSDCLNCQ